MKQELTGQLIEYDQCRRMAALLRAKGEAAPVFVRRPMEVEWDNTYALHHAPQILADYWQALAGRTKTRRVPTQQQFEPLVTAPMVSVTSRVVYILRRMLGGTVAKMEQLFSRSQSRSTNVATFLALLELVRGGRIVLKRSKEILRFCTQGVAELGKLCEVYASTAFEKVKPRRFAARASFHMRGGRLVLELLEEGRPVPELLPVMRCLLYTSDAADD